MRLVDLSVSIEHHAPFEAFPVEIDFRAHDGAGLEFFKRTFGVTESDLVYSDGKGAGDEMLTLLTHSGTHVDAPFHYGPISEGAPAATIDELPLEWFFGDGVVLDLRHKQPGRVHRDRRPRGRDRGDRLRAGAARHRAAADRVRPQAAHRRLLRTARDGARVDAVARRAGDPGDRDRRVRLRPPVFRDDRGLPRTGDGRFIWPAHFAGITRSYCQIEKLANLDAIGRPHGFKVAAFPVKIQRASAGFARVVAFVED